MNNLPVKQTLYPLCANKSAAPLPMPEEAPNKHIRFPFFEINWTTNKLLIKIRENTRLTSHYSDEHIVKSVMKLE